MSKSVRKFVGRKIRVETHADSTNPQLIVDGDRRWSVAAVEKMWFDTGHGSTPAKARNWRTRRHRKNFVLLAENGDRLHLYLDYQRADKPVWFLVTVKEAEP